MSNTSNIDYRINRSFVPGSMIYIARFGTSKTPGGPVASATSKPVMPDISDGLEPEFPWLSFGKVRSGQIVPERKKLKAEGIGKRGRISSPDLSIVTSWSVKFSTNWTVPETYEMLFGTSQQVANGMDIESFISQGNMKVWLCGLLMDLNANQEVLLQYEVPGVLSLADSPTWQTDVTTNNYELVIESSPLTKLRALNVQAGSWDVFDETGAPEVTPAPYPIPNN